MKYNKLSYRIFIVSFMLIMFFGCNVQKRLGKIAAKHPVETATFFNRWFTPVTGKDSFSTYKPGKPVLLTPDTTETDCFTLLKRIMPELHDSLAHALSDSLQQLFKVKTPCPPCEQRVDTFENNVYWKITDKSKEILLKNDIDSLNQVIIKKDKKETELKEDIAKLETLLWILGVLGAYTVLRWIIKAAWPAIGKFLP